MADRGSALLFCVRCGRGGRRSRLLVGVPLLLIGGELVLAFEFQFELHLVQFAFQPLVFGNESLVASEFGINLGLSRPSRLFLPIRPQYQRPQRRATQMRAVADMRTFVFMFGVKTESHRHSFPNAETLSSGDFLAKSKSKGTKLLPPTGLG